VPGAEVEIGEFRVRSALICHPDPTVGFRITSGTGTLAYLTDHEPALGVRDFPEPAEWTSGYPIAADADVLIHDAQYTDNEYRERVGWGHSSMTDAMRFAELAGVRELVTFHHDPDHDDDQLDALFRECATAAPRPFRLTPGLEGAQVEVRGRVIPSARDRSQSRSREAD
jgi:ribonuclease BN (tRNA processing enzyme)